MKAKIVMAVLAVMLGAMALVLPGCMRHDPGKRAECAVSRISSKLDLSKEQEKVLVGIKDELMAKRGEFKPVRTALFDEIVRQTRSDKVDAGEINKRLDALEAKIREMRPILVSRFAEFHATLTPEQRAKLANEMEKRRKWHDK
jgi:Spy/CpxP family protein refolding chaperone